MVGEATAKVGESKIYQFLETVYYNDTSKNTETLLDFPNAYGAIVSSDPSDVINGGTVTFGSVGKRILKPSVYGEGFFEVTVTKDFENPTPDTTRLEEAVTSGDSKLTEGGFADETTKALEEALQKAKDILANPDSIQKEIDNALSDLETAISNLKKKDITDTSSSNSGTYDSNNSSTGNSADTSNGVTDTSSSDSATNNDSSKGSTNKSSGSNQSNNNTSSNTDKDLPKMNETSSVSALLSGLFILVGVFISRYRKDRRA
ncbi:FIVAR domain-containing protein [Enterococcus sp. CWB-B31]|uniref:FIVAR domain-containing protein n=1 Tax=Enterococcus sp. CWB-B31 TaxID=2885159 RepID=UPI001E63D496|nr:FIVAR domain-containing protein [Enterococcus sp. CWB-B31]MCB5955085.1 FIVAR domain-containing protein [Enterococcus sp. CWB-B31]